MNSPDATLTEEIAETTSPSLRLQEELQRLFGQANDIATTALSRAAEDTISAVAKRLCASPQAVQLALNSPHDRPLELSTANGFRNFQRVVQAKQIHIETFLRTQDAGLAAEAEAAFLLNSHFYPNARMDSFYGDTDSYLDFPCSVRFERDRIKVEYEGGAGPVSYSGTEIGAGHYKLTADGFDGAATLHCFEGSNILEGFWIEDRRQGMWRVTLGMEL